jgi:putative sigma-54 modulation protein
MVKGLEANEDYYSSIDLVVAKIERQLRKYKDRIRDHKPSPGPERAIRHRVFGYDGQPEREEREAAQAAGKAGKPSPAAAAPKTAPQPGLRVTPQVIKEEKFIAQPMSVEEAIMRMNLLHESFLCFNNVETHEVNVVYRRDDATYGLIETTHADKDPRATVNG